MVDYQALSIIFAGLSIAASIVYYASVLSNANKASQRELIIQRSSFGMDYSRAYIQVRSMTDWKDKNDFYEKYISDGDSEEIAQWLYLMRLYDLAGLQLKEGADPDLIFRLYPSNAVLNLWEQFEPVFKHQREVANDLTRWESIEYLYREAKKRYPNTIPSWRNRIT
jgi:hypothetical protein